MSGRHYEGWFPLAEGFPPTLNKDDDATTLKPNETPDAYGIDPEADGFLKTGSVLVGDTRLVRTDTIAGKQWNWYYNRSWQDTGRVLNYTAPFYRDADHRQGLGKIEVDTSITTFAPVLSSQMWVCTPKGSHFVAQANDPRGFFFVSQFEQGMFADSSAATTVLNQQPWVCNKKGVFSFDGRERKEWTRPVRDSIAPFASKTLVADYSKRFLVGGSSFVIDTETGNLFSYATTGFRYTSPTLTQKEDASPFTMDAVRFVYEMSSTANAAISWQSKFEDGDWTDEEDVDIYAEDGMKSAQEKQIRANETTAHKFAMRITALSSNIKIRQIQAVVKGLSTGSMSS